MYNQKLAVMALALIGVLYVMAVIMFMEIDYLYNKVDFLESRIDQMDRYCGS